MYQFYIRAFFSRNQGLFFFLIFCYVLNTVVAYKLFFQEDQVLKTESNAGSGDRRPGDCGLASLCSGSRMSKSEAVFAALGDIDELTSLLGVIRSELPASTEILRPVQGCLLNFGAVVSGCGDRETALKELEAGLSELDERIARWSEGRPLSAKFIIPGDHPQSARVDQARAVSRRMERTLVSFYNCNPDSRQGIVLAYANRLSLFLYEYARSLEW